MSALSHVKLGLATAGVILFAYGVRAELSWLRWAGIVFLAGATALRFWDRRPRSDEESPAERSDKPDSDR